MFGYLPETVLKKISLGLNKPYSVVAGVVSFYSFFTTVPRGKHLVRVCLGTACYVRGGKETLAALEEHVGDRGRRNHFRPLLLAGRGTLLRRLRHGPRDHDRRRRSPAGETGAAQEDPRPVPRPDSRPPATETTHEADHRHHRGTHRLARRPRGEQAAAGPPATSRFASAWGQAASPPAPWRSRRPSRRNLQSASCSDKVSVVGTGCLGPCSADRR